MDGGGARAGDRRACARRGRGGRRPAAAGLALARDAPRHRATRRRARSAASYRGDRPWSFKTARGIFSTPVIGADGTVYVGSADGTSTRSTATASERWRFRTGGIIDAAAALGRATTSGSTSRSRSAPATRRSTSCAAEPASSRGQARSAGRYRTDLAAGDRPARQLVGGQRRLRARRRPLRRQHRRRRLLAHPRRPAALDHPARGNSVWTTPAFDARRATATGARSTSTPSRSTRTAHQRWQTPHAGLRRPRRRRSAPTAPSTSARSTASCTRSTRTPGRALGLPDRRPHLQLAGARRRRRRQHDRDLHRLGRRLGLRGRARRPAALALRHRRPGPLLAGARPAPKGDGKIVYVGSSNGTLYALDAATGSAALVVRHDAAATPRLRDRNDLNGSPALGKRGVYIGGEHGRVWFVPYDYCLHTPTTRAATTDPAQEFGSDVDRVFAGHPGRDDLRRLDARRSRRRPSRRAAGRAPGGTHRRRARSTPAARSVVTLEPAVHLHDRSSRATATTSSSVPTGFLKPDTDYRVRVARRLDAGAGGQRAASTTRCASATAAPRGGKLPLRSGASEVERARAQPPGAAAAVAAAERQPDRLRLLRPDRRHDRSSRRARAGHGAALGDRRRARAATASPQADPNGNFAFPLSGPYRGDESLLNASQVNLQFSFGPVPLRSLDFRGELGADGRFAPGREPLRPGHLRRRPELLGPALHRRRLQRRRHARLLRHLPQRRLRQARRREPQAEGRERGRGDAHRADRVADGAVGRPLRLRRGTRYRAGRPPGLDPARRRRHPRAR